MFKAFINITKNLQIGDLSSTERVIYWGIILTPVWWLLGIQPLLYPAVVITLLAVAFSLDRVIKSSLPACIWAWLIMALVMLWTAILGLYSMGFPLQETAAGLVTFLKSYFFIFASLALPFWTKVRVFVITRAVAWMATSYLINTGIQMLLLVIGIRNAVYTPVLARLIPGDKSSLQIVLASIQSFFGIPLPRTVLYTPDPPILGISSVLCFLICLNEKNHRLRNWALAGSLCGLLVSFSRLAWMCLPLALLIVACFQSSKMRQTYLWLASLTFLICSFLGLSVGQLLDKPLEIFDSARSSSSAERALVVSKTLEAWQEKLWLGWGVIQGKAHLYEDVYISLGSFSTYAAVLYLHGIVGMVCFVLALLLTLFFFYTPAVQGNTLSKRAFACLAVLYLQMNATPLSWMAVYMWFFFLWLGTVIQTIHQDNLTVSSWEQLSEFK
ncbi:O-antigen ligase family protein [Iningainema tapete]|uniref:O-antigen ligase family protein n=1 Tax=Iningainema tapete BLCC-T55 TaxID=2748662 RepID=A0A8J6XRD0_9CYAN|nr:O-antigen ligase family protein [Iningainema tapete]MBD2776046.1 O-antigen ligase family protein [Iningainema tapete BLCC-T55]